jgi:hypothetical protein
MPCPLCFNPYVEFTALEHKGFVIACDCGLQFRKFELTLDEFKNLWNTRRKKSIVRRGKEREG